MTRLEKIVAEQLKRGDIGTAIANSTLISKLKTKFKYGITVYNFIDRHGVGKKYPPLKADEVINLIPKNTGYKIIQMVNMYLLLMIKILLVEKKKHCGMFI